MIWWLTVDKKGNEIWCLMFRSDLKGIRIEDANKIMKFRNPLELLDTFDWYKANVYEWITLEKSLF